MAPFNRIVRGLQKVFPSSGLAVPSPKDLSESVSPVYEFPGKQGSLDRSRMYSATSVAALTGVITIGWDNNGVLRDGGGAAVFNLEGQDVYTEILYGDISHDSASARVIQLFLQSPGIPAINVSVARWTRFLTALTPGTNSGFMPIFAASSMQVLAAPADSDHYFPNRPLIIPPSWKILIIGDTAGVAYSISLLVAAIVHPLAEPRFFD